MAIYHFSAKVISRANGSSALAAAAYRSASRLNDERLDRHHDMVYGLGSDGSMLPIDNEWLSTKLDRSNRVASFERGTD